MGALCQSLLQGVADLTSELACQTFTAVQLADFIESTVSVLTKCLSNVYEYVLEEAVELLESADVLLFRQNVAEKAQFWTN